MLWIPRKRNALSPASRLFSQKKPLIEGKAVQHDQSNLVQFFPCPLDRQEAGNLMHHDGLLVIRQVVQRPIALHHPLAEGILQPRLQISPSSCGRRRPAPHPTPSAARPVRPIAAPLAATLGVMTSGVGISASNFCRAHESAERRRTSDREPRQFAPKLASLVMSRLFDRFQRPVEEERVDIGPNVFVVERNPALLSTLRRNGVKEKYPFILQEPKKLLPARKNLGQRPVSQTYASFVRLSSRYSAQEVGQSNLPGMQRQAASSANQPAS